MFNKFVERPHQNEKEEAILYVKNLLEQAKKDNSNEDVYKLEKLIRVLQTKKYGLVWEEHAEAVEEEMKTKIPVFVEDESRKITGNVEDDNYNFLIEGDNLHSLHLLNKTHLGKIDIIYIDPPYNTGKKDFKYNDKFIGKSDGYIHSKWLSFMNNRLEIAKQLLSDKGIIFISIDDNEQAQLKLLCDEIFGGNNFVTQFIVENNPKGRKNSNFTSVTSEYCIVYAKNKNNSYFVENIPKPAKDMSLDDEGNYIHNSGKRVIVGENKYNNIVKDTESDKHYSLYYRKKDNSYKFLKEDNIHDIDNALVNEGYKRYISYYENHFVENTYTYQKLEQLIQTKSLEFKNNKIYEKNFKNTIRIKNLLVNKKYEAIINNKKVPYEIDLKTTSAKQQLTKILGEKNKFDNPKNVSFIKLLLSLIDNNNAVILDFFAGSGTTGHAVEQLNQEDGGHRKYILCTNNENNIAEEVTYQRLKNIQEELPHNIKYFKTSFVDKNEFPDFELENELLKYITPLVELEFGVDISNPSVQIILNEEQLKDLVDNNKLRKESTLYIHPDVFFDSKDKQMIADLNITIKDIPDYFFGKELWS